jgi:spermidine/putrescine-binding protein
VPFLYDTKFIVEVDRKENKKVKFDLVHKPKDKFRVISIKDSKALIFMPYLNLKINIDKNDIDRFKKIVKYLDEIHKNLEENKKYLKKNILP